MLDFAVIADMAICHLKAMNLAFQYFEHKLNKSFKHLNVIIFVLRLVL